MLPQSNQYRNLSEGADRVGGQLRGDKECPFSGVTKSGRVWRKVPESDSRSHTPSTAFRHLPPRVTLQAPLSGTFLQTLPGLVTPLKGHFLSPHSCLPTQLTPSERFGHTPSIAFRHLPPNSARFSYATEAVTFSYANEAVTMATDILITVIVITPPPPPPPPPQCVSFSALALACRWVQNQLFDTRFRMAAKRPVRYTYTIRLVRDRKFDD